MDTYSGVSCSLLSHPPENNFTHYLSCGRPRRHAVIFETDEQIMSAMTALSQTLHISKQELLNRVIIAFRELGADGLSILMNTR